MADLDRFHQIAARGVLGGRAPAFRNQNDVLNAALPAYARRVMIEALWVFGALGLLIAGGTASITLPPEWLLAGGFAAVVAGSLIGIPAGVYYHVVLRRKLLVHGPLPDRWWLHPVQHHDKLSATERRAFMPWFLIGGAGFALIITGAACVGLGLLRFDGAVG